MLLPGYTGSSTVSVSIEPNVSRSVIPLSSVYELQLLPLLDRFGHYFCEIPLSVPTRSGFFTSNLSLECSHPSSDANVTLGSDWLSVCSAAFNDDGTELEDPPQSVISSLPTGNYWTPNDGAMINC